MKPFVAKPVVDSTALIYAQIHGKEKAFRLDTLFRHLHDADHFNGTVLVAQRGVVIYKQAFGFSDYGKKDTLSLTSSFQLASVSKQFTAAAIMLLEQEGKLNYNDSLQKFFPTFPYHGITIRLLLTHRAGLANYLYFLDEEYRKTGQKPDKLSNTEMLTELISMQPKPYRQPDVKYEYSNTGYALLAAVVEKISGQAFCAFMKENFFKPLHMDHTYIITDTCARPVAPKAYYAAWKTWDMNCFDYVTGDKGVFSTVEDMYKWSTALYSGSPLTAKTLAEAFTPASPEKKGTSNYGFGWRTRDLTQGGKAVFHNGWWHGYTSAFFRRLDDKTTIVILCNKFNRGIYNLRPVLDILGGPNIPVVEDEEENASAAEATTKP